MGNLIYLLTSFDGRIPRSQFWKGAVTLILLTFALTALVIALGFGQSTEVTGYTVIDGERSDFSRVRFTANGWASMFISVLLAWPWLALSIKRRHDRGGSGNDMLGYVALLLLTQLLGVLGVSGFINDAASIVIVVWTVCLFILLGLLKGTPGDNRFGPDPLSAPSSASLTKAVS